MKTEAQQDVLFSQFANTKNHFNPATSGLNYRYQACAMAREQWNEVSGAPSSQFVNFSMKIDKFNSGIGVNYLHDDIGFSESSTIKLNYAYHLKFEKERILSFGITAGITNYKLSGLWLPPTTTGDPWLPSSINDTQFTTDFGIAFSQKNFNVGLSSTHLTEERFTTNNSTYQSVRHYYVFADYTFGKEEGFQFRPELLVVSDQVKISAQINAVGMYKGRYYLGIGYRSSDALIAMIGWDIKQKFRIGYSYDRTINLLNSKSTGSHEIVLGFYLK
jgi:type IX secretion system PorP/SprF family membrane protein